MNVGSMALEAALPSIAFATVLSALLPWLDPGRPVARAALAASAIFFAARYVWWRWTSTLPDIGLTADFIAGLAFVIIETLTIFGASITYFILSRSRERSQEVNEILYVATPGCPSPVVDVFICTYNEEKEILERTIVGALSMDYPTHRVWILDDGRRGWLEDACRELGCGYITRSNNSHAKAGNINHALAHVASLPVKPDFINILDADFVPAANFLRRTLALFEDPSVGIVQTPQHFINGDPLQANLRGVTALPDEQRFFFDVIMPSKDAWGAAFCCGTSSVIRFDALVEIGGFPTASVTEDYLITLRMDEIGFKTIYLNERLSLGLAPEGLKEYITQRSRWCLGLVQICRGRNGPFNPSAPMSLIHRLCLIESFLFWAASHSFRLACIAIPILYLLCNVRAVEADLADAIANVAPYLVAQIAFVTWVSRGRVLPIITDASQLISAPEILKSVALGLWKPNGQPFKVTAKGGDRSKTVVQWKMMRLYLVCIALTVAGVLSAFVFRADDYLEGSSVLALFWSWYNIVVLVVTCFVCIELPRPADELGAGQTIAATVDRARHPFRVLAISRDEVQLIGEDLRPRDSTIILHLPSGDLVAKIVRRSATAVSVRPLDPLAAQVSILRHLYNTRFAETKTHYEASRIGAAVLARVFD